MAILVYITGVIVSLACAVLLLRGYVRGHKNLLLWSGLCFLGLAVANALIFVDLVLVPELNLYRYRLVAALIAMCLLLYGLIWENK